MRMIGGVITKKKLIKQKQKVNWNLQLIFGLIACLVILTIVFLPPSLIIFVLFSKWPKNRFTLKEIIVDDLCLIIINNLTTNKKQSTIQTKIDFIFFVRLSAREWYYENISFSLFFAFFLFLGSLTNIITKWKTTTNEQKKFN